MKMRANKRRTMYRLYGRVLAWYSPDLGPLADRDIETIRKEAAKHLPKGKLISSKRPSDLFALLDKFDPKQHGGEEMAFAPIGQEFGSPDYDKLAISLGSKGAAKLT